MNTNCFEKESVDGNKAYPRFHTFRRLTIKSQALKRKKSKKCAALDKQHTDAEKRQRGRRREQDDKAGMRPRFEKL